MTRMPVCLLLVLAASSSCLAQGPVIAPRPDAVQQRIISLKEHFVRACSSADLDVVRAIEDKLQAAQNDGEFDVARRMKAAKESFEKEHLLPTDQSLVTVKETYRLQFDDAKQQCLDGFEAVVADCTTAGDLLRASAIRAEKERWRDRLRQRKTPTTRYVHKPPPRDAKQWAGSGHFYKFFRVKDGIGWNDAKTRCEREGGYLACGETSAEIKYLKDLSFHAWTGGYKNKGKWVWVFGAEMADKPKGEDDEKYSFASTDPTDPFLIARPENGVRAKGVVGFICEWDD